MASSSNLNTIRDHMIEVGCEKVRVVEDEVYCACPWHADSDPSFSYNVTKNKGHCFACKASFGSLVSYIRALHEAFGIPEDENTAILMALLPTSWAPPEPEPPPIPLDAAALRFYDHNPQYFVDNWGISLEVAQRHDLVLDPYRGDECFPVFDWDGNYWGSVHRWQPASGRSRYRYPPHWTKSNYLIGEDKADSDEVWVVEGIRDLCKVESVLPDARAVALGSSHPSKEQMRRLMEYDSVVLALDKDTAGKMGSNILLQYLPATILKLGLYDGSDPFEAEAFEAKSLSTLMLERANRLFSTDDIPHTTS